MNRLIATIVCGAALGYAPVALATPHEDSVNEWREAREARLAREDGWLTLVGLEWLQDGRNYVGSAADNDIVLPGGPAYWGVVTMGPEGPAFRRADNTAIRVDGGLPVDTEMVADTEGEPTLVEAGSLSFTPIFRESYALRVKDSQAPARLSFEGLDYFPVSDAWLIDGAFERAAPDETVEIVNVLGQVVPQPVYGTLRFEHGGKTHEVLALGSDESDALWFIFADRTNSRETYGAGRYLYSEGMPEDGRLLVDFNKAYNPPCAFNDYSTCPIPPPENRLDLRVEAGEKNFKH